MNRKITYGQEKTIIEMYEQGSFMREISRKLNLSNTTVRNVLVRNGVKLRNPSLEISRYAKNRNLDKNSFWKGGRVKRPDGYIRINLGNNRTILEHRYVMEKHIGRKLKRDEHVHHINGIKNDNRIENLQLLSHSEHSRLHGKDKKPIVSKEEMSELLDKGFNYKTASEKLGISKRTFYNMLDKYNLRTKYERLMKNA